MVLPTVCHIMNQSFHHLLVDAFHAGLVIDEPRGEPRGTARSILMATYVIGRALRAHPPGMRQGRRTRPRRRGCACFVVSSRLKHNFLQRPTAHRPDTHCGRQAGGPLN